MEKEVRSILWALIIHGFSFFFYWLVGLLLQNSYNFLLLFFLPTLLAIFHFVGSISAASFISKKYKLEVSKMNMILLGIELIAAVVFGLYLSLNFE